VPTSTTSSPQSVSFPLNAMALSEPHYRNSFCQVIQPLEIEHEEFQKVVALRRNCHVLCIFSAQPSQAERDHPNYLHALSDLRLMRAYLDRLTPSERIDEASERAIAEIDAAIREVKQAAIDDGKDLRFHAPVDAHITPSNRFHKAREAGNAAWRDVNRDEDNGYANGLKHRALQHIEAANHIVDQILRHIESR